MCKLIIFVISHVLTFIVFKIAVLGMVKECDFTQSRQDCSIKADPGDQIKMKCAYQESSESSLISDEDEIPRCFSFVNPTRNNSTNFVPLISLLPGAYGFEDDVSNGITTASVFIPPVVPMSMGFKCFCDQLNSNEGNTTVTKNVLTVSIIRSYNTQVVGCNFTGYVSKYSYIQNMSRNQRVCNVTARSTDTVALLCPTQYKIDPPKCFNEVYKYQFDNVLEVSRSSAWKKVSIQSILGEDKKMNTLGKDSRVIFSSIPENVTNQSIFMCRCVADDENDLIFNVFLNKTFVKPRDGTLSLPKTPK